mmetsp:Transcript_1812/g.4618  ORF Transcript_1812/g.4618 Transcript_1812/m.4618 type:complete len:88 (+) Transcript_1812:26-289(+)|eukprot:CAMPEP_0202357412 /NCGR_PEP_ID=MMETSP1126-20121109/11446_1 /ASSEMBLY_ACC=CAM_ASM_000457 /TAXON_ID=3047 /ORGANISM="Dunaliella tertiolecta, Strain CCMP1320" /LENGTH=87 /DNA_ID=CAMNT_0048950281 /DNA_START=32 /DNA_END=295 /DNA_ORIENTATION=+
MDALSLASFEERAALSEARLAILESKLAGGQGGGSAASHADLQALRATLVEARKEAAQAAAREQALEEENAKLKYQIVHLKRAAAVQ